MPVFLTRLVAVVAIGVLATNARAAEVVCSGTVETLAYHANNALMMKLSDMNVPVFFCSPDIQWSVPGVGYVTRPGECKALYATFLAAKLSGRPLTTVFFDGDGVPASCGAWAPWSRANVRYYEF